ncbi:Indoleamine 2,3-dioxygenase [Pluteus cervinus]|uniref:Indoleamine 2,3-dioxygenase n=1 Tax=Pluteus cervinus TaxID=181527 RepID=A0ACD3BFJ1_9AGAR|nr:Indoleamine 2,3-dioxygenase [Pluteus cervinus]
MDFINVLASPPHFFRLFFQLAFSLFYAALSERRKASLKRPSSADYELDATTGPFPREPLQNLPPYYTIWEDAFHTATHPDTRLRLGIDNRAESVGAHIHGSQWRADVASWPVLDTECLQGNVRFLQRAHYVLAWLVNLYVHSLPPPSDAPSSNDAPIIIPKSLAVPLAAVSRQLRIAPVLTFADTVLWNWEFVDATKPLSETNMKFRTFSGTRDEEQFYLASATAELHGIEMLRIIDDYHNLPNVTDLTTISKVARDLGRLKGVIEDISAIIQSVRAKCEPHVFYWQVRPWFEGHNPSGASWVYEGVPDSHKLDLNGPSAGQSTVMHAVDLFLDIDHKLRQRRRYPAPSSENRRAEKGFMERMRRYMPGKHRDYLLALSNTPHPVRDLAAQIPTLRDPYDGAVDALKNLRSAHIRIACLYVVSMTNSTSFWSRCPIAGQVKKEITHARGTGGNEVTVLLKAGRDATYRAMFKPPPEKYLAPPKH